MRALLVILVALALAGCVSEESVPAADVPLEKSVQPDGPAAPAPLEGSLGVRFTGACLPPPLRGCAGMEQGSTTDFVVDFPITDARLELAWDADAPGEAVLRLRLTGGAAQQETVGQSPLVWELGDLPPGAYTLRGEFASAAAGVLEVDAEWVLAPAIAPAGGAS